MNISIIGTGYVGLISGICLAEKGHRVVCVDIDGEKVAAINRGIPPIHEKGLDELLRSNLKKRFSATSCLDEAVRESDVSIIAVGTPFDGDRIDLKFIREAAGGIGRALGKKNSYHVVVVKSTVVPGTTDEVVLPVLETESGKRAGVDFGVGMNPEFLREGEAVEDFMHPDRIVLGGVDESTHKALRKVYAPFEGVEVIETNNRTAEMIKYAANSLLATLISFSNEVGNLCSAIGGVDSVEVMKGVHLDRRVSPIVDGGARITPGLVSYLAAGCGFGGSCFPKDVKALIAHGKSARAPMELLESVIGINERQPMRMLSLLRSNFPDLKGVRVSVLGLAFKPGTDDMRESPAIPIVRALIEEGATVYAYDPAARAEAERIFGTEQIHFHDDLKTCLDSSDAVLLLTRWPEFERVPDFLSERDPQPIFIDGRRMIAKNRLARYEGIGLGPL